VPRPTNQIEWTEGLVIGIGRVLVWCFVLGVLCVALALTYAAFTGTLGNTLKPKEPPVWHHAPKHVSNSTPT
jgi:hypothetical protein